VVAPAYADGWGDASRTQLLEVTCPYAEVGIAFERKLKTVPIESFLNGICI
jgi:hypothetical protein